MAAIKNESDNPGPAVNAPLPVKTKIPVPIMAPIPRNTKSHVRSVRLSGDWFFKISFD